jgi:hypothetical protein
MAPCFAALEALHCMQSAIASPFWQFWRWQAKISQFPD